MPDNLISGGIHVSLECVNNTLMQSQCKHDLKHSVLQVQLCTFKHRVLHVQYFTRQAV